VSTNIAETSLTFPRLRYVVDMGMVQRPRSRTPTGAPMTGALMETLPASRATLRQRVGRVGRTMGGDYLALYSHASISSRKAHIDPKMALETHEDIIFSLQLQLREKCRLHFPTGNFDLPPPEEHYFRFPNLGGARMARAFFAGTTTFHCGDDILMLAALRMKMPTKTLQELAQSGQGAAGTTGDISTVITLLRRLEGGMPSYTDPTEAFVISWCNRM
jgi:hypothetical protein